jgi:hypothetical protein
MPFHFRAYFELKENLGLFDAMVEVNEIALREFIANAEASGAVDQYLSTMSAKHNIKVDAVNISSLKVRVSHFYILSVYQQFEEFLEKFRDEHPNHLNWQYQKGDTLFDGIIKNLGTSYSKTVGSIGTLGIELFNYYRAVRNRFMHTEITDKKLDNKVVDLKNTIQGNPIYSRLSAPQKYNEMSFDDFVLFTRVCKAISDKLCTIGRPTDNQILEMVKSLLEVRGQTFPDQMKTSNDSGRLNNSAITRIRCTYGLTEPESIIIIEQLMKGSLA